MNKRIAPVLIISILWAFIFNISKKITTFTDDIVSVVMLKTLILGNLGSCFLWEINRCLNEYDNFRGFAIIQEFTDH